MKLELNGIKYELNDLKLEMEIRRLIEEKIKPKRNYFVYPTYDIYSKTYSIDFKGEVIENTSIASKSEINNCSVFESKEFAEALAFKQLVERKLFKFRCENDFKRLDWNDGSLKYYISMYNSRLSVDARNDKIQGVIYFSTREICKKAIELFKYDLIKYFDMEAIYEW